MGRSSTCQSAFGVYLSCTRIRFDEADRKIPAKKPGVEILKQCTAAAVMGVVVYLFRQQLGDTLVLLTIMVSSGAVVYFIVLFAISNEFRQVVIKNVPVERIPNV